MKSPETDSELDMENEWHLDKRVPISMIVGLVFQTVVITVFLVGIRKDVDGIQDRERMRDSAQHARDDQQDAQVRELMGLLRADIKELKDLNIRNLERRQR